MYLAARLGVLPRDTRCEKAPEMLSALQTRVAHLSEHPGKVFSLSNTRLRKLFAIFLPLRSLVSDGHCSRILVR
mgnify:CR=1 FL=1|jgi:hypothetical protein